MIDHCSITTRSGLMKIGAINWVPGPRSIAPIFMSPDCVVIEQWSIKVETCHKSDAHIGSETGSAVQGTERGAVDAPYGRNIRQGGCQTDQQRDRHRAGCQSRGAHHKSRDADPRDLGTGSSTSAPCRHCPGHWLCAIDKRIWDGRYGKGKEAADDGCAKRDVYIRCAWTWDGC